MIAVGLDGNIMGGGGGGFGIIWQILKFIFTGIFKIISAIFASFRITQLKAEAKKKSETERNVYATKKYIPSSTRLALLGNSAENEYQYLLPASRFLIESRTSTNKAEGSDDIMILEDSTRANINLVVSGGNKKYRNEALSFVCKDAVLRSIPVIIIHCNNIDLVNKLQASTIASKLILADDKNFAYNPFWGLSEEESSNLIVDSLPEKIIKNRNVQLQRVFILIKILATIASAQGRNLTLNALADCDINNLAGILDKWQKKGTLSSSKYNNLLADFYNAQSETPWFENYQSYLKKQLKHLCGAGAEQLDIKNALAKSSIIAINTWNSVDNDAVIGILTEHLRHLYMGGMKAVVVVDGLSLATNEKLIELLSEHSECNYAISSEDIYASFKADKQKFETLMGRVARGVFFKHNSTGTDNFLSTYFGKYERTQWLEGIGQGGMIIKVNNKNWHQDIREVNRITIQDLARMTDTQMLICDSETKALCFADIHG